MSDQEKSCVEILEFALRALHDRVRTEGGSSWSARVVTAANFGYMDAKHIIYMMQTFGFPLWAYIEAVDKRKLDLKIPWMGLEHELLCIGKERSSIDSLFKELQICRNL